MFFRQTDNALQQRRCAARVTKSQSFIINLWDGQLVTALRGPPGTRSKDRADKLDVMVFSNTANSFSGATADISHTGKTFEECLSLAKQEATSSVGCADGHWILSRNCFVESKT